MCSTTGENGYFGLFNFFSRSDYMAHSPACTGQRNFQDALSLSLVFLCLSGIFFVTNALAVDHATFSWRANPQDDAILGYRLYYGSNSRYDTAGHLKSDFNYDFYLDFAEEEVCRLTDSGPVCGPYNASLVQCENLAGERPRCTLHNLSGWKHFTMTAYNAAAESLYTTELKAYFDPSQPYSSPTGPSNSASLGGRIGTLNAVYTILLKDI
jgi:hypothetical protein